MVWGVGDTPGRLCEVPALGLNLAKPRAGMNGYHVGLDESDRTPAPLECSSEYTGPIKALGIDCAP